MSTPKWGSHSTAHCPLCRLCLLPRLDRAREARRSPRAAVTLGVRPFPILQLLPENGANGDEKTAWGKDNTCQPQDRPQIEGAPNARHLGHNCFQMLWNPLEKPSCGLGLPMEERPEHSDLSLPTKGRFFKLCPSVLLLVTFVFMNFRSN